MIAVSLRRPVPAFSAIWIAAAVLTALSVGLAAAAGQSPRIVLHAGGGDQTFTIEWAVTPEERARGLMFRESMAADHGMIFDFGSDRPVAFWMKNTPLALDMIFIRDDGTVDSIAADTTPFSEASVPSGGPVRYVLEVLAGTSKRIGLVPGDRISFE